MQKNELQDMKDLISDATANAGSIARTMQRLEFLAETLLDPSMGDAEYRDGFQDGQVALMEVATDEGLYDDLLDLRINLRRLQNIVDDWQQQPQEISDDQLRLF